MEINTKERMLEESLMDLVIMPGSMVVSTKDNLKRGIGMDMEG